MGQLVAPTDVLPQIGHDERVHRPSSERAAALTPTVTEDPSEAEDRRAA